MPLTPSGVASVMGMAPRFNQELNDGQQHRSFRTGNIEC